MRYFLLFFYFLILGLTVPTISASVVKSHSYSVQSKQVFKAAKKIKSKKTPNTFEIMGLVVFALILAVTIYFRVTIAWMAATLLFLGMLLFLIICRWT